MMWHDQIKARTNAANMSAVWKYLKLSEKDAKIITSTKHRQRETALRCFSCLRWEEVEVVDAGYCDDFKGM